MTLNSGFDPEDPPPPKESPSKPPWESTLQTDHRRSAVIRIQSVLVTVINFSRMSPKLVEDSQSQFSTKSVLILKKNKSLKLVKIFVF
jgi:hypothetical protein